MAVQTGDGVEKTAIWIRNTATGKYEVWDGAINVGDISIGAVEIKDHDSETRASVGTNGLEVEVKVSDLPTGAATSANQTNGTQQAKIKEVAPTDATQNNPAMVFAYDGDGNVSTITRTISGVNYVKTFTYAAGILTNISSWV